jgi:DNA-binding transcriptional MerR regulator
VDEQQYFPLKEAIMKKKLIYMSFVSIVTAQMVGAAETANYQLYGTKSIETIQTLRAKNLSLREQRDAMQLQVATDQSLRDQETEQLRAELAKMMQELRKEEATKMALKRDLAARDREQQETKQLLDDILSQKTRSEALSTSQDTPPVALPLKSSMLEPSSPLSAFQQQLLSQWREGKIGPKAWAALGGDNVSLAIAVLSSIQGYPGQIMECSFTDNNNFKLLVDGKLQSKLHKFK